MDNPLMKIIDAAIEEHSAEQEFRIDTPEKAEWALLKIREEMATARSDIEVHENMIRYYQDKVKQIKDSAEHRTGNLKSMLFEYFQTVPRKATKTQEVYSLPSGKLKLKYQSPEYKRDEPALLQWLKDRGMAEYIQTKETPQWGELKKATQTVGDKVVMDGEILEGVEVIEREPVFEVEV